MLGSRTGPRGPVRTTSEGVLLMRKLVLSLAVLALALAGCAQESSTISTPSTGSGSPAAYACAVENLNLKTPGQITIATNTPAFNPWFRHNDPTNGQGYEGAVAYDVADGLGFTADEVEWVIEPFGKTYAPGPKDYDFAIEQISITPERAQAVDFSAGYYDDQQALIAIEGTPIADATTIADLKPYTFGVQVGTTSLSFITQVIQPDDNPAVYDTTNEAKNALANGQVDGMILDLPTASYTQYFIDHATLVGKFPSSGEQFGLVFEKGNALVSCVDPIIEEMRSSGTLDDLADRWLQNYLGVPLIQ